jgi:uncharacterized protein
MQPAAAVAPALEPQPLAPVEQTERITALDSLRGFALLGILLMNIVPFGIYAGAYDNPTIAGGATGANLAVWAVPSSTRICCGSETFSTRTHSAH